MGQTDVSDVSHSGIKSCEIIIFVPRSYSRDRRSRDYFFMKILPVSLGRENKTVSIWNKFVSMHAEIDHFFHRC